MIITCVGPKSRQAAGVGEQVLHNLCVCMILIQKWDYFNQFLLEKPSGKILEGNISIGKWLFYPRGHQLAQQLRVEALCKNLTKWCHCCQVLGVKAAFP